jgi:hypothetical protein
MFKWLFNLKTYYINERTKTMLKRLNKKMELVETKVEPKESAVTMNELGKKAILVQLNVGWWAAKKYDKEASEKTEDAHGAKRGVARVSKQLISKEHISEINNAYSEIRTFFYSQTRPWAKNIGILKNSAYDDFTKGIMERKIKAEQAKSRFLPLYPDFYEKSKKDLGKMWKAGDYPHPSVIGNKFYVSTRFMPIPNTDDFRVEGLGKSDAEEIKKNIEQGIKDGVAETLKTTYEEFADYIAKMVEKLDDGPKTKGNSNGHQIFRDSLVDNLKELVSRLPKLNIADDPNLYAIGKEIEEKLCKFDADELRADDKLRATVKKRAEGMLKKVEGYF